MSEIRQIVLENQIDKKIDEEIDENEDKNVVEGYDYEFVRNCLKSKVMCSKKHA